MKLQIGDKAPEFELNDQDGKQHKLSDYAGRWTLLYFYPKDFTPGCTTQARMFRDQYTQFQEADIAVIGISTDTSETHKRFQQMHELPFVLLADPEKKVVELYGVLAPKEFKGREFTGTNRTSFLVDPDGNIVKIYENVKPAENASEILRDFKELSKKAA